MNEIDTMMAPGNVRWMTMMEFHLGEANGHAEGAPGQPVLTGAVDVWGTLHVASTQPLSYRSYSEGLENSYVAGSSW